MGITYDYVRPHLTLDEWQRDYINSEGNNFLLCGRQVGKSTAASIKAVELAVKKHKKGEDILIIALTERQAFNLFTKALSYASEVYPHLICKGKDKPTKHEIRFTNGVKIMCHPTGLMGDGLRGFTCKKIICDEPAKMAREVFVAIMPMLSVVNGSMDLLGTPCGKQGFFYEASLRDDYKKFYVSAETCPRADKKFLDQQKEVMSEMEYAQEYLAIFLDELRRVFSDNILARTCNLKRPPSISRGTYTLGVDCARLGEDSTTLEILEIKDEIIKHIESVVLKKTLITEIVRNVLDLDNKYNFKEIGIDGRGVGAGVVDMLLQEEQTRRKVKDLDNSKRALNRDETQYTKALKEDMYMNLLSMLEKGKLMLLDDDEVISSLKSVQYEYITKEGQRTRLRIFGNDTHIAEGLIRAAWLAKSKNINIWLRSFKV